MRKIIAILLLICSLASLASCARKAKADNSQENKKKMEELFQKNCSADEALKLAKESGAVVIEDLTCTSGKDVWEAFFKTTADGNTASVLCAHYYTIDKDHMSPELYEEEKDDYPCLFFYLLEFDGNTYSVKARQSNLDTLDREESFKYLQHFNGNAPATALYRTYDRYVLLDEKSENWEEIEAELLSSQYPSMRKQCWIYTDLT
ncbi:MAG: hypothetical protein IK106_06515 [Clostridiales bacterium]|nr:hypothetical protein [Clostridiales bacterium]